MRRFPAVTLLIAVILGLADATGSAQDAAPRSSDRRATPHELLARSSAITFRNLGPFRTSAWVTEIAVPETPLRDHLYTIYAATRSGGLWKTSNNGVTWDAISDSVGAAAVGAIALAPSNPQHVWMGTGANDLARSSYSGKGVYKSTDAGKTWTGGWLPDSHHIARIVIHPANPDIVYVAAMGHLFSRNAERGVFRTKDGGKSWEKVLFVHDGVGAVDLVINRTNPSILYAAMYEKYRYPWELVESGPGTGIHRSDDGGTTWRRLEGGLPSGRIGRIGLDIYQKNPNILYAVLENQNPKPGPEREPQREVSAVNPLAAGIIGNQLYRTDDGGVTWRVVSGDVNVAGGKAPYSFNQLRINPHDDKTVIVTSDAMYITRDGGATWGSDFFRSVFGDFRTMWWDPQDENRVMLGSDGGVNVSYDGGRTSDYFLNMPVGEIYAIGVDMDDPYNVYAGLQDHDSWKGPSNSKSGSITLEQWTTVGPGDGMYNQVDPTDSRWVYNTRELGNHGRFDQTTGERTVIAPRRDPALPRLRYNWIAPLVLSPHDPKTLYAGAQVLFRSQDRGDSWHEISRDLTTNDPQKIGRNVPYATITTISESPVAAGTIWVGTDDGKVQVTRDAGGAWVDATPALAKAGAPVDRYVSRVFASPHDAGTAFVAKSGFRNDDFRPFLYRTSDFGATWTPVVGAVHTRGSASWGARLPDAPINVVVQDRVNPNLLFVGNDLGVWFSLDGGNVEWLQLKANLPTVAVHDLTIHPRENDLVLGTYGRGLWIGDITALQQATPAALASAAYAFDIEPRARYGFNAIGNYDLYGDKYIQVPNEPDALVVRYWLREKAASPAKITVADADGKVINELSGPAEAGLNQVLWNMRPGPPAGSEPRRFGGPPPVAPGNYRIRIDVAGQTFTKIGTIKNRPIG
jgi:photosystem II stability/assembly factor-like uncharacterized protein